MKLKAAFVAAIAITACAGFSDSAFAVPVPIPGLFPTGVDGAGVPLPDGAIDPNYALTISSDATYPPPFAYVVAAPLPPLWVANTASAKWINPAGVATSMLTGPYEYEHTFDLTGLNPSTAIIFGEWALDDGLIGNTILINGSPTGITHPYPGWASVSSFGITSGFIPGINTLTFITTNEPSGGFNPTGLFVESLAGTAEVPEPAGAVWFACALLASRRRRGRMQAIPD